ncbi:MAG: hypothetical protein DRP85_00635 [Candidatus Makaraimicrobium thalassicum]|nr:MAG: hypothetical protein DRP85_00635 [Candidatus Omnitrophota bacterium]
MFYEEYIGGYVLGKVSLEKALRRLSAEGFLGSSHYRDFVLAKDKEGRLYFLPKESAINQKFRLSH